jgi:hypothetical protein
VRPVRYARIGGALYLLIIVAGIVGPLVTHDQLIVPNDAVATAATSRDRPSCGD